jgi:hypothetical protein
VKKRKKQIAAKHDHQQNRTSFDKNATHRPEFQARNKKKKITKEMKHGQEAGATS